MEQEKRNRVRIKTINRRQMLMKTLDVEELVDREHPVRAIWEFVGRMDLESYYREIEAVEGEAGRPALDPQLMICLWIYGYSEGVNSAREIARRCQYHPAYQWLTGMEPVNHHSLSDFRIRHEAGLRALLIQVLGLLTEQGLVTLQRVMHDGTKVKACASGGSFRREKRIRKYLKMARKHVEALEAVQEEEMAARVLKGRQRAAMQRQARMERALAEMEKIRETKPQRDDRKELRVSVSDPEARIMKQSDGGYAPSYNVQISTDAAAGIIVGVGVVKTASDQEQLTEAVERIEQTMGQVPRQVVVDGAYTTGAAIVSMHRKGVDLIGSFPDSERTMAGRFEQRGIGEGFRPEKFVYEETSNSYRCPTGKVLRYVGEQERCGRRRYTYQARASDCQACDFKEQCCPGGKHGRRITRTELTPPVAAFKEKMETEEAKKIYRQRSQVAEFPNAWLKSKLGLRQFRLRGLVKVTMEVLWACLTYNIQQWIRLCWKQQEGLLKP